jgi:hypothetical protein
MSQAQPLETAFAHSCRNQAFALKTHGKAMMSAMGIFRQLTIASE